MKLINHFMDIKVSNLNINRLHLNFLSTNACDVSGNTSEGDQQKNPH